MDKRFPMNEKTKPKFASFLKERSLKRTPAREEVLREAFAAEGHFEADELVHRLRKKGSRVSKATVYRTLPLLVQAGLLTQVIHGEKHQHYEHIHEEKVHDHLVCLQCGQIIEFQDATLREAEEAVCRRNHFQPRKILVEIFGTCRSCQ
jgi:Fur family transcriptional regulator, ferric uptake regulator